MPTVDITAPAGAFTPAAVGDTQDLTTTFTIANGSTALTCNGASPFVSGDTGKSFFLHGAGSGGADGTWLSGTLTFVSSTQVTLSNAATIALSTTSANLIWGTDDAPAWRACNVWAQAQSSPITINLGTGAHNFLLASGDPTPQRGNAMGWHTTQPITINGNGSSTSVVYGNPFLGAGATIKSGVGYFGSSSNFVARLNQANRGDTTLTCKTIADSTLFTTNTWSLITGIDLQGAGFPMNPYYFEYVFITAINTSTGVITIQSPLVNTYLDTWPVYAPGVPGSQTDLGGPATLYVLDSFGVNVTYQNMGLNGFGGQIYPAGLTMNFTNVTSNGLTPTNNQAITFTNCDVSTYQMEVDKLITTIIFDNTKTGQVLNQSANNTQIIRNGSNVTGGLNCTARFTKISNSTINGTTIGPFFYGKSDEFTASATTFTGTTRTVAIVENITTNFSMTRNIIKVLIAGHGPVTLGVPGTYMQFTGSYSDNLGNNYVLNSPVFQATALTSDGTYTYITTNWPFDGGIPFWATKIQALPGNYYTSFDQACTSADLAGGAFITATAAGHYRPATYSFAQLNGSNIVTYNNQIFFVPCMGRLVFIEINITTPYTGTHATLLMHLSGIFDNNAILRPNLTSTYWGPKIDLRTAGRRIITNAGVTGAVGLDSGLALPDIGDWIPTQNGPGQADFDITAEYAGNPAVGPVLTWTMLTDQSLAPLGDGRTLIKRKTLQLT